MTPQEVFLGRQAAMEALHNPQILTLFFSQLGLAIGMAFTKQQLAWFKRRSENQSELPLYDETIGWHLLGYCDEPKTCPHMEVNHIQNQADNGQDTPDNGIRIPKCIHVGVCPSCRIKEEYALKGNRGKRKV